MNYSYQLNGKVNARPIKTKQFKNYKGAMKYLDSLIDAYNVQIEEVLDFEDANTFIANDYSRFTLVKLS